MNWADTVKATGLAAMAERTTKTGRIFSATSSGWSRQEGWLTRVKPVRTLGTQSPTYGPSMLPHQSTASSD
jgi:hypothetical protein